MTVHPSLQTYADAWTHSVESIAELVKPLAEGEWNRRTPCPGWSVRDIVSHIIGMECEQLGDPRPIHTLPRDLYHVQNDFTRYMEMQVDVRRHHTAPEMTSELEYTIIRRSRQLRNESRDPETMTRAPLGAEQTLELALRMRAFDVWVHEQDLRTTLGAPGNLDSPEPPSPGTRCSPRCRRWSPRTRAHRPIRRSCSMCTGRWSSCARSGSTRTAVVRWTVHLRWGPR